MSELSESGEFNVSGNAWTDLKEHYSSGSCWEEQTSETITRTLPENGELLCPHSAVGVYVANKKLKQNPTTPMITLATAHPAKFPAAVEEATGIHPPLPPRMADLYERSERITRVANDLSAIQTIIRDAIN